MYNIPLDIYIEYLRFTEKEDQSQGNKVYSIITKKSQGYKFVYSVQMMVHNKNVIA